MRTKFVTRIPEDERPRWPLTAALVDLWCFPWSARYLRFATSATVTAGRRITGSGHYEVAYLPSFVDVLDLVDAE